jgi:hypothetical protein
MDAAVPVDAQNAPTATWKTAQNAVSHSAHTLHRVSGEPEKTEKLDVNHAPHTKFLTLPSCYPSRPAHDEHQQELRR